MDRLNRLPRIVHSGWWCAASDKKPTSDRKDDNSEAVLKGTTLSVYRFLFRQGGRAVGPHEVERGLGLSSASVASYHLTKLSQAGLVREEGGGYVVDRVVFENVVRIRRMVVPFQTSYAAFFGVSLVVLLTIFRPTTLSVTYYFAVAVVSVALASSVYETVRTASRRV